MSSYLHYFISAVYRDTTVIDIKVWTHFSLLLSNCLSLLHLLVLITQDVGQRQKKCVYS
jgi:hypothetical protein